MTRKEAVKWLERIEERYIHGGDDAFDEARKEALHMAIEALEDVQKHEETFEWCHDCKEYDQEGHCCHRWTKCIRESVEELKREWKRGEWIFNPSDAIEAMFTKPKCSECGFESADGGNYCSNCGADMRGGSNDGR